MNKRFIIFENNEEFVRFIAQEGNEPRDGRGTTILKFKCINGKSPIELLIFTEEYVLFKILLDCNLYEGEYKNKKLKINEKYKGYPDGSIVLSC